jgi:hypothetical protein
MLKNEAHPAPAARTGAPTVRREPTARILVLIGRCRRSLPGGWPSVASRYSAGRPPPRPTITFALAC